MIEEDYVSFKTAKLLKEKGFDCLCHSYFRKDNPNNLVKETCGANWNDAPFFTSRPTLQMAMKWFRIKHNILLFLLPVQENGKLVYLVEVWIWKEEEGIYESAYAPMPRKEPEQAVEAAIKYCLENLI